MRRWSVRRLLFAAWAVSLLASTVVRLTRSATVTPAPDESTVPVALAGGRPVVIAYRRFDPPSSEAVPALLIHGSPGDNGEVTGIGRRIGATRLVVAPDLPGFGASTRSVPDYSIAAHARYVLALMDSLGVARAHLVGFSMGGGVILEMADRAPDRVASLTLLSALGAQEYELLGDYHLNHAVHWLQLAGIWAIENLIPHFGALDGGFLSIQYARNFYDTDQRPLRRILSRYEGPALVVQGDKDPLVDPAVARESHRLVPQSEMAMFTDPGANHFLTFQRPDTIAATIEDFLARTDAGLTATRATAEPSRLALAARDFDPGSIPAPVGIALGVLLLAVAAATLVSEDLACIAAGLLVSRGTIDFVPATVACFAGIVIGDLWLYSMGRYLGRPALARAPLAWFVTPAAVDRSAAWFRQRGMAIVLFTRFVPGTRLPTYVMAGILRAGAGRFLAAFLIAALLWTPLLVGASVAFGEQVLARFLAYESYALPGVLAVAAVIYLVLKLFIPMMSWRGRRLLLSRWRRLRRWEFWPPWAVYPPIVLRIVMLAIRHRSLTLFTAANPAIPGGGLAGESKADILAGLGAGEAAAGPATRIARWTLLDGPVNGRAAALARFQEMTGLGWPIVLKPDIGERGGGVAIVHSAEAAHEYLAAGTLPVLAQEYVPGVETGLFYYRLPGEERGHLLAITDKRFPVIVGDGRSTLERLILADDTAVSMAPTFLAGHLARLGEIPAAGQEISLVQLGTHSRGARFYDGEALRTPALEAAVDRLSRGYAGFWIGRYDVRSPSREALMAGEFTVIELNGITGEPTSLYDPKNTLLDGLRLLDRQWRLIFEIAARNVARGARPTPPGELLRLVRAGRRASQAERSRPQ